MVLNLTDDQRRALEAADENFPIEVVDATTGVTYVLMRADHFARLAALADPALADDAAASSDSDEPSLLGGSWR